MDILYICSLNCKNKTGLFNATMERLNVVKGNYGIKVFSLLDTFKPPISNIQKFIYKQNYEIEEDEFNYKNINCSNLIYKRGVKELILKKLLNKKELDIDFYVNALSQYIENNNVDLIHAHWSYPQGYVAMVLSKKYSIPYVITAHGSDIHTGPIKNAFVKNKTIEALNNASKVFFVSENLKVSAIALGYSGENSFISPNGINKEIFNYTDYMELPKNKPKIGYVGNLVDIKGVSYLPKIFKHIQNELDVEYEIVGDGNLRAELEEKMKENNIKCTFYGKLEPQEIPEVMSSFDVLVVPSKNEGWPCVILEANSLGVYVVGSNVGGIHEAVGKYGIVVDRDECFEANMANSIINIMKSGYNKELLIKHAEQFSWENIVKKEMEEYIKIISECNNGKEI